MYAWKRLSLHDMSHLLGQVDDEVLTGMFTQMGVRKDGLATALLSSKLFGEVSVG